MAKTILVGVDDSPAAARAAARASELARDLGARLHIVSAVPRFTVDRMSEGSDVFEFSSEEETLAVADGVAAGLRQTSPDITTAAHEGEPAKVLVRVAEELGCDLIVVGNKRVQGMARILGSIAADVARHAPCDVYIVHTHDR